MLAIAHTAADWSGMVFTDESSVVLGVCGWVYQVKSFANLEGFQLSFDHRAIKRNQC
jgi:hypothetical protein